MEKILENKVVLIIGRSGEAMDELISAKEDYGQPFT